MFIPKCCPRCREEASWREVINPFTTGIPLGKYFRLRLSRGARARYFKYRCGKCGYEGEYDDHAETLKRRL